MKIILFPGQGAQFKGMGKALFPRYRALAERASDILGYAIEQLCVEDQDGLLRQTQYTQPALYVVGAMHYQSMLDDGAAEPEFFAGHSIGEYNALLAAGAFDFATGLRLVQKRGALMAQASGGGMAAVIGLDSVKLQALLEQRQLREIDLANFNTPSQTVIAGPREALQTFEKIVADAGARLVPLNVSAAFHSRYMRPAQQAFSEFLQGFHLQGPRIPVIANATAQPYGRDDTARLLAEQLAAPVRWTDSIRYLIESGADDFVEIGSSILGKMVEEIRRAMPPAPSPKPTPQSASASAIPVAPSRGIAVDTLGSAEFKRRFSIRYPYMSGAMYRGISSPEIVVRMGKAGMMGFLGTGGMPLEEIDAGLSRIQSQLSEGQSYGMNLLANYSYPERERQTVELYLRRGVRFIEAAAFTQMTSSIVLFRLRGLGREPNGRIISRHRVLAKLSRPEVAEAFMSPPPEHIVAQLLHEGAITPEQAELAKLVPVSADICVEADSGGHTDGGIPTVLFPAMLTLKRRLEERHGYADPICMGLAGGIGTPESAAAAFVLGADFILTGSINQCTVEAGTSGDVKTLLQEINVQDTEYAPAGDMFEVGAKVQVLKRGVFFPTRANKLFSLYSHYNSLDEIPDKTRAQLEKNYFKKSLSEIWDDTRRYLEKEGLQHEIAKAETNPKHKMALVFRWYFSYTTRLALDGVESERVNYQVHIGPALGAFNQWVKGTPLEDWRRRHVDEIGKHLLEEAANYLNAVWRRLDPAQTPAPLAEKTVPAHEAAAAPSLAGR
ncbi:ACP S-malonyltransferase [Chromobacterium alticapitis]|uniref:[acyl-carrier-protein] S-malonyltransferase n=1 Tax=Chromobacterium alticapitis TaxID=2073169 RepID=A0A2S5DDP0_9NEIS|nr:ACP S-malonyltransferase [Chromobacterium alticapitis]POZ61206.1 [acyl-carrier-protein] S-malonyltransferase [Chromobacterium alticapitis]